MPSEAEIRRRLSIALQLPLDAPEWLEEAEHACIAHTLWVKREAAPEPLDLSTLGGRIQCAREILGMDRAQCAARAGMKKGHLRLIEEGRMDLPAERLTALRLVLGVTEAWLLGESDEGGPPVPLRILRLQASPAYFRYVRRARAVRQARKKVEKAKMELEKMRAEGLVPK